MLTDAPTTRSFLSDELARRLRANPRYSQRAFARQLGLSAGELSELLRGRRALSPRSALRIARALGLSRDEAMHLLKLAAFEKAGPDSALPADAPAGKQLTLDVFHIVSDWYCFALLNLAETDSFRWDAAWIARRLGIAPAEARLALERLERVGLIERDPRGRLHVSTDFVMSPSGIPSEAVRGYHRKMLAKASEALDAQAVDERDVTGVGFAVDPRHLPELRKSIARFQDELVTKFSRGRKSEVYHLEMALFRITQSPGESK